MFSLDDYNYDLQEESIAQVPVADRETSRLLFVERIRDSFSDHHFYDLPGLLRPGDLLVVNNTRVVPAKLFGRKESGGRVEVLVLRNPGLELIEILDYDFVQIEKIYNREKMESKNEFCN